MTWGAALWGRGPWGGPGFGPTAAMATRENVVRVAFSDLVYASDLGDAEDAIRSATFTMATLPLTVGRDSFPPRPVAVVRVQVPDETAGVPAALVGRFLDLTLDRPMSPWPAAYTVAPAGIWNATKTILAGAATLPVEGLYRQLVPPSLELGSESMDLASPQSMRGIEAVNLDAADTILGTLPVDDSGDYALDSGTEAFRKRVMRVITTVENGFAHLPGYGLGVTRRVKQLATVARLAQLVSGAEEQIARDPDCLRVRVSTRRDPTTPSLMRLVVLAQPKHGKALQFDVPFATG